MATLREAYLGVMSS